MPISCDNNDGSITATTAFSRFKWPSSALLTVPCDPTAAKFDADHRTRGPPGGLRLGMHLTSFLSHLCISLFDQLLLNLIFPQTLSMCSPRGQEELGSPPADGTTDNTCWTTMIVGRFERKHFPLDGEVWLCLFSGAVHAAVEYIPQHVRHENSYRSCFFAVKSGTGPMTRSIFSRVNPLNGVQVHGERLL